MLQLVKSLSEEFMREQTINGIEKEKLIVIVRGIEKNI